MSTPSDTTTSPRASHHRAPPSGVAQHEPSAAERVQMEHGVRTAAVMAAQMEGGSLPRAVLDFIVASSDWRQPRQALESRAASIANHVVNDVKAPNFSGAHPNDVAVYLASIGRQFGDYRRHQAMLAGSREDANADTTTTSASRGSAYTRELGGETYNALARQGYRPEHIHSAIGFARDLGTSDEMAKKFIRMDHQSRDRVRDFMTEIESDPSLTPEQKQERIRQFRQDPKIGKHLTEHDLNRILEDRTRRRLELRGEQVTAFELSQAAIVADQQQSGIQRQVERQHNATVATLNARPEANHAEDDELAAIASRRVAQTQPPPPPATAPAATPQTPPAQPTPPATRQAAAANLMTPKV